MKRIVGIIRTNFIKNYSSSKSGWNKLKNTHYMPNNEKNIVLQDKELELEFKYTKQGNKIIKELLDRRLDGEKEELNYPKSELDAKAFDCFIKQDESRHIARHVLINDLHISSRLSLANMLNYHQSSSFSTLKHQEKEFKKNLVSFLI